MRTVIGMVVLLGAGACSLPTSSTQPQNRAGTIVPEAPAAKSEARADAGMPMPITTSLQPMAAGESAPVMPTAGANAEAGARSVDEAGATAAGSSGAPSAGAHARAGAGAGAGGDVSAAGSGGADVPPSGDDDGEPDDD